MKTELWKKQADAFEALKNLPNPALLMGMGTGKTRVQLELLEYHGCRLTLVVCPKAVIDVWPIEVDKHCDRFVHVITVTQGSTTKKRAALLEAISIKRQGHAVMVVINYESVWRPSVRDLIRQIPWDSLVLDESHRAKSPGSSVNKFLSNLATHIPYRSIMTGTPVANTPLDIYGQYKVLDPTIFGTRYDVFKQRYAIWGGFENRQVLGWVNQDELAEKMHSIAYRVTLDEVVELPDGQDVYRYTHLEPAAAKVYRQLRKEFVVEVNRGEYITTNNALTKLLRLHQLAGGLAQFDDGHTEVVSKAKRQLLDDTLYDVDDFVVIFCRFQHDMDSAIEVAKRHYPRVFELSGRHNDLESWRRTSDKAALVVQIDAGAEGIDLTRSHTAIYYSIGFSLGKYLQSRARIRRPGQTHNPLFIHLAVKGTVDYLIMRAIHEKQDVAQYVLDHTGDDQ